MSLPLRPAVFLDRDGVINVFPGEGQFVRSWREFVFMPEVHASLQRLRERGFFLALVTNQSGVGRGLMAMEALDDIHHRMQEALGASRLDGIYFCPHHPDDQCACRKPSPHLLQQAAEREGLNLAKSFVVGDSGGDIEMGRAAGCRTVLCREKLPPSVESMKPQYRPDRLCRTLPQAVEWILEHMANQGR